MLSCRRLEEGADIAPNAALHCNVIDIQFDADKSESQLLGDDASGARIAERVEDNAAGRTVRE